MEVDPPKLYNFPTSFHSQKVLLALAEKGIPYRTCEVNLGQYENCSEWYMKINPKGQVPVLEDDGKHIIGSTEIIKYLDDVYEGSLLTPSLGKEKWEHFLELLEDIRVEVLTFGAVCHPHVLSKCTMPVHIQEKMQKAVLEGQRRKALHQIMDKADPGIKDLYLKKIEQCQALEELFKSEDTVKQELEKVRTLLEEVNHELKDKKGETWLCGPDFTIADVCLAILLQRLKLVGYAADLWEDGYMPYVEAYYTKLLIKDTFRTVCIGGISYFTMMRYAFGDHGTIALIVGSITAMLIAVWLGLYMVGKV